MQVTFISGATGGIGKAFCTLTAKNGDNLFLTGRSQEKLAELATHLRQEYNANVDYFACDLTNESSRNDLIAYADSKGYTFSKIINVAGVDIQKPFIDYTESKVLFQTRVNVEATICLTHALLSRRAEQVEIITISSMSGATPMPYFALYSATKAMLINFFTALRYEFSKKQIKITIVMPGGVPTRPDLIEEIKKQGIWGKLSAKPALFVAEKALKAVKKNKAKCIPGFFNKFLYWATKLAPKCIVLKFIARRWKKTSKDAF